MRNFKYPPIMAKVTAMLCQSQDIDLIYLRPWDVDINNNTVKGKMFINNKWEVVNTKLPFLIDIAPYCFTRKNKEIIEHLRNNTVLTYDRKNSIDKERLQRELLKDEEFRHLVIPTCKIQNFSDIEDF